MLVQRVLILLWKYLLVKEEELFYWWKVSKFLLAALFANARRVHLMLANFGLKIRPFWDSHHENWYSYFSRKQNTFCENNLHQITYLPKRWRNEGNRFFQLLPLGNRYFLTVALNILIILCLERPLFLQYCVQVTVLSALRHGKLFLSSRTLLRRRTWRRGFWNSPYSSPGDSSIHIRAFFMLLLWSKKRQ